MLFPRIWVEEQLLVYILAMVQNTIWPKLGQNTSKNTQSELFQLSDLSPSVYFALSCLHSALFMKQAKSVI
jgi:transposase